ncbi:MAG: protein arginine kinase [Oscillospiraceae bacterium]|nr:protein arginine kinase [Oscillospiraceae bacterium]
MMKNMEKNKIDLKEILAGSGNILGPECDVAISSRVRLARNLADYPFPARLDREGRRKIAENFKTAAGDRDYDFINFADLSGLEIEALAEKRIISPEFAGNNTERELITDIKNGVYVMLGEEDHLRIQCIKPGFAVNEAFEQADDFDNAADLNYAYSEELGYLTQCPTNLGTGLRASVMMHLPALTMSRQIERIVAQLPKLGLTIRGFYGEGSEVGGDLYQISSNITLGVSEDQTLEKINSVAKEIMELERSARAELYKNSRETLTDKIKRAYGILKHAYMISSMEFLKHYSAVRLGFGYGIIKNPDYKILDNLLVNVMPANLTINKNAQPENRDIIRAEYIQEVL